MIVRGMANALLNTQYPGVSAAGSIRALIVPLKVAKTIVVIRMEFAESRGDITSRVRGVHNHPAPVFAESSETPIIALEITRLLRWGRSRMTMDIRCTIVREAMSAACPRSTDHGYQVQSHT